MKTVSLELAKQLKEAGFLQGSYFWWKLVTINGVKDWKLFDSKPKDYPEHGYCAAPVADEILDLLPMPIDRGGGCMYRLWINRELIEDKIELIYVNAKNSDDYFLTVADTLADSAAKMWLCLKKKRNLMTHNLSYTK